MYYVPDHMLEPVEKKPACFCDQCNGEIYEGDVIYKIDKDTVCEDCILDYLEPVKSIAGER